MQRFETYLTENLPKVPSFHPIYEDALGVMLEAGGKRFRPMLLLSIVDAYEPMLYNSSLPVAFSRGMVLGQAIDCYFENKPLDLEQIKTLHTNKTAKLIAVSLQMGAVIVGLDKKIQDELYAFGIDLGLLFQIQDDIIDETQSEEEAGKTTGNDADKNSFVNLLGLDETVAQADALAKDLQRRFEDFDEKLQTALQPLMNKYLYRHTKDQ
ncbi:MAG: hypothetical protein B6D54_05705 [Epsilonproteobacteria bacterium 4484_65]|nr:MAG: hypothetical protein B6D54_05705 [Epsilonproteobacteria bacterium 4484_65]